MLKLFKVSISLVFVLFFVACKDEVKDSVSSVKNVEQVVEKKDKKLKIEIEYVSSKADDFRLILNNIKKDNQSLNLTLRDVITNSSESKTLTFEMPFDGKPTSISFGLGNKEVKEFTFKNINLTYDKNSFTISEDQIEKYFNYNKFVSYDASTKRLVTKKVNNLHSPVITLKPIVKNSIYK